MRNTAVFCMPVSIAKIISHVIINIKYTMEA